MSFFVLGIALDGVGGSKKKKLVSICIKPNLALSHFGWVVGPERFFSLNLCVCVGGGGEGVCKWPCKICSYIQMH